MLEKYFESRFTLKQLRSGPGGAWIDSFAESLHDNAYSWWTSRAYLRGAHHFGQFLEGMDVTLVSARPSSIDDFRRHLKHCRCSEPVAGKTEDAVRGAARFLAHLWTKGVVSPPEKPPTPPLVSGFCHWLACHRGAAKTTVSRYGAAAIEILEALGDDPAEYGAKLIRSFLLKRSRRRGVGGTRAILSPVRMFLRYLAAEKKCAPGLDTAVPAIAGWRLATLPKSLSMEQVAMLLAACEPSSTIGLRDRAVILLLARLGLRASDVSALRLTDIDWCDGSVLVKGKTRREARLPLPQEVGDAILAYLEKRPRAGDNHVFLRAVAPLRSLPARGLSQIVTRAMRRAGVTASSYGAHILRHAAATEMLRNGASLYDIGSVLRHRSADMSAYYAKVDMELLKHVVQPWPEVSPC
jgi:site-specific recombinase XerD